MFSGKSEISDTEGKKCNNVCLSIIKCFVSLHDNACVTPRAVHAILVRLSKIYNYERLSNFLNLTLKVNNPTTLHD